MAEVFSPKLSYIDVKKTKDSIACEEPKYSTTIANLAFISQSYLTEEQPQIMDRRIHPAGAVSQKRKAQHLHSTTTTTNNYKKHRTDNGIQHKHNDPTRPPTRDPLPAIPPITPALGKAVFTHQGMAPVHSSHSHTPQTQPQEMTYDRLEFLGDAYIEVVATRLIWGSYASLPAGRMSQIRELLVKNDTLHEYAVQYAFDKRIRTQDLLLQRQRDDERNAGSRSSRTSSKRTSRPSCCRTRWAGSRRRRTGSCSCGRRS